MKIATLSIHPIDTPQHGGQHRLANIVAQYRTAGHRVGCFGVLGSGRYPARTGFLSCQQVPMLRRFIYKVDIVQAAEEKGRPPPSRTPVGAA